MAALAARSTTAAARTVWLLASGASCIAGLVTLADALATGGDTATVLGVARTAEAQAGWMLALLGAIALWPASFRSRVPAVGAAAALVACVVILIVRPDVVPQAIPLLGIVGSLAAWSAHSRATAGRWIAALAAAVATGLPFVAFSMGGPPDPAPPETIFLAGITRPLAAAHLALGVAFLARAWTESPQLALQAPTWAGLPSALLLAFVSVAFFRTLEVMGWSSLVEQARTRESAVALVLQQGLNSHVRSIERIASVLAARGSEDVAASRAIVQRELSGEPSVCAIEWISPDLRVVAADPPSASAEALTLALQADPDRHRAARMAVEGRSIEIAAPVAMLGGGAALYICIPLPQGPGGEPAGAVAVSVDLESFAERTIGSLDSGFEVEVQLGERLVFERGGPDGANLAGSGAQGPGEVAVWTVRAAPTPILADSQRSFLPLLVLGVSLIGSALVGSTIYFAQAAALRAAASQQERAKLEQLLDAASHVAVVATDPEGTITIFNHGAEALTGWRAAEVVNLRSPDSFVDLEELVGSEVPSSRRTLPAARFGALLERVGDAGPSDWTWVQRDGTRRRVSMSLTTWRDVDASVLGHLLIAVDVNAREVAMRQLAEAKRAAERANEAKSSFLANVSHEVRTPMASIIGYTDLMLDPATPEEERMGFVNTIRRSCEHMLAVVNDILDLSKIEAGRLAIESIPVGIMEVVQEVVRLLQPRAAARGVELGVVTEAGSDLVILSDALRLRQILMNLAANALKFTEKGWVRIAVSGRREEDLVRTWVRVSDSGVGLTESEITRLFQSFAQADVSTTRRFGGTGLGLAISQRLAQLLGGEITVQSRTGEGSTFTLEFCAPAAPDASEESVAGLEIPHAPEALSGRRVLIVEGAADGPGVLLAMLARTDAAITLAHDAREVLDRVVRSGASGEQFDVMLLDAAAMGTEGRAAIRRLRAIGYAGRIVILLAQPGQEEAASWRTAGADTFVARPISREALVMLCAEERPAARTGPGSGAAS